VVERAVAEHLEILCAMMPVRVLVIKGMDEAPAVHSLLRQTIHLDRQRHPDPAGAPTEPCCHNITTRTFSKNGS